MANPLITQYQRLANALDTLIQQATAQNQPSSAQQLASAQGTLRAAAMSLIANDIDTLLSPTDPQYASVAQAITNATVALQTGATQISADISHLSTIVSISTNAFQIASALVPPNPGAIIVAATNTVKLLQ